MKATSGRGSYGCLLRIGVLCVFRPWSSVGGECSRLRAASSSPDETNGIGCVSANPIVDPPPPNFFPSAFEPRASGTLMTVRHVPSSSTPRARASGVAGVRPDVGFGSQDEGVLHSVLEDIREWRVSSTLVDDPIDGEGTPRTEQLPTSPFCPRCACAGSFFLAGVRLVLRWNVVIVEKA